MVGPNPQIRTAAEDDHEAAAEALARSRGQARSMASAFGRRLPLAKRNRNLYERNGFALTGTFDMPAGGPPLREMWRDPL